MAKFRHLRAAGQGIQWVHGVPNASLKETFEYSPEDMDWEANRPKPGSLPQPIDFSDHSTANVEYGEERYQLSAHPAHQNNTRGLGNPEFRWLMHKQIGPDANDPNHWKLMAGPHRDQVVYLGDAYTKEEALRGAEQNWDKHVQLVNAQNPMKNGDGYDINQIMRDEGF